ncbi:DinB family protein [Deinococcus cellulosilyticus]|uniref:DinB family protein n=1 Tax=Deinococcus cellulosilyticus (strain DSM 18568 / NBRC 106333 / KACC 11606 / 5516J-15) TaxID=1223518 RepID=A0A511MZC9_DEIC1|nr:DinB family protein [Deinococcus cellulosilyticus]GEM45681.1 hypothetical protein DC3_13160 [Deinococcus cellulosilyticus NBRC 106333 = KACC 11606]
MPYSPEQYTHSLLAHRLALIEAVQNLSEDQGNFTAWEGGMSVKNLIDHLSQTNTMMLASARKEPRVRLEPSPTLQDAVNRYQQLTEQTTAFLSQTTPEQLSKTVEAFPNVHLPLFQVMDMLREHDIHHKGQVWTMLRLMGIKPPMFVKMPGMAKAPKG